MQSNPVYCRPLAFRAFSSALGEVDAAEGLFRAAFAISLHEKPEGEVERAEAVIVELAKTIEKRFQRRTSQTILAHLHDVLFELVGFAGNTDNYYQVENSYLGDVLATRRGIPITLVLVYKLVAERLGLVVHGINAPGHFLASVELGDRPGQEDVSIMYVDPFYGGGLLNDEEVWSRIAEATGQEIPRTTRVLKRATHRQWLARMLNNLQAVFASQGRERDIYAMQELQGLL